LYDENRYLKEIPRNRFVVVTGLSGSGKSALAFDILHKEGQRQYLESLGLVDYMSKPDVDQHLTNRSPLTMLTWNNLSTPPAVLWGYCAGIIMKSRVTSRH
jgi:excinuclease ABC subunit A